MSDGRIYSLKVKSEAGDLKIYVKNPFEVLFGGPTPFSFSLILAPYLFSFDATDLKDNSKIGLDFEKLKIQLQQKEISISDKSTILKVGENNWMIVDRESFYVVMEEVPNQKDMVLNVYRSPEKVISSQIGSVRRIIDLEKPAHTTAGVVVLQPWIYLDMHTYLGINTFLSEPVMRLEVSSVISRDTVLTDMECSGQVDKKARLGVDTRLV